MVSSMVTTGVLTAILKKKRKERKLHSKSAIFASKHREELCQMCPGVDGLNGFFFLRRHGSRADKMI